MSKARKFLNESEMTEDQIKNAFDQLKKSVVKDLDNLFVKAMKSGALDIESYDVPVLLAKVIMKAALIDEADAFAVPDAVKKDIKNLSRFL